MAMDIAREKKPSTLLRRLWYIPVAGVVVIGTVLAKGLLGDASYVAEKQDLRLSEVMKGELTVDVRGHGVLKAKETKWISAEVAGRVEQIPVKAGDPVQAGALLVQLSNPELQENLLRARWELKLAEAETLANLRDLESRKLDLDANVLAAKLNYEGTKLRLEAETRLLEGGQGTISQLEYQRTLFAVQEQKQRWGIEEQRQVKMQQNIEAQRQAQQARIARLRSDVDRAERQVQALQVTAPSKGVVQTMDVELGQSLSVGSSVARIADHDVLIAALKIQELQVQSVLLEQPVTLDTRNTKFKGKVARIDPAVTNGMVQVDVAILDELPREARPDLSVEGVIRIAEIKDTLYVQRPVFAQRFTTLGVYRVADGGNRAMRIPVEFGQSSVNHIQVLNGLHEGDRIVISDPSAFEEHEVILIN